MSSTNPTPTLDERVSALEAAVAKLEAVVAQLVTPGASNLWPNETSDGSPPAILDPGFPTADTDEEVGDG